MLNHSYFLNKSRQSSDCFFGRFFSEVNVSFNAENQLLDSNHNALFDLSQAAKNLGKEFYARDLREFFDNWGDHIYDHGMAISDPKELQKFTSSISEDIDSLYDKAGIESNMDIIPLNEYKNNEKYVFNKAEIF